MIQHAEDPDLPVTAEQRRGWLVQAETVRAGPMCECGDCPSVGLVSSKLVANVDGDTTLWAGTEGALLMLFVEGGRLTYLELAPIDDDRFLEFPPVAAIDFSAQLSDG